MLTPLEENERINAWLARFLVTLSLIVSAFLSFMLMVMLSFESEAGRPNLLQTMLGVFGGLALVAIFGLRKSAQLTWKHYLFVGLLALLGALVLILQILS